MQSVSGLRRAMIGGRLLPLEEAALPVTDDGVARGDGAFETVGVWDGRPFRLPDHLQRLQHSLSAIGLPGPDLELLEAEAAALLEGVTQDAALRIYVTGSGTRILTLDHPPSRVELRHLVPQPAPWIRPVGTYGPAGAKTMSYMPNMAAIRAAQVAGGDDALLVSLEGLVLEGPTFSVYWVLDGVLHAPSVDLGIVDSISRRTVLELARAIGHDSVEGAWPLADLVTAEEVLVSSSVRDVVAIRRIGDLAFTGPTPVRDALSDGLDRARRGKDPASSV